MKSPLFFSVVVPVYEATKIAAEFRRFTDSVLAQSCPDFELIFVDDCSPDGSMGLLQDYARSDERVRVFRHETNQRQGIARNTGTRMATGRYIIFCDFDDFLVPKALESLRECIVRCRYPDFAQLRIQVVSFAEPDLAALTSRADRQWWRRNCRLFRGSEVLRQHLLGTTMATCWGRAIRADLARAVPFESLRNEDLPQSMNLHCRARTMAVTRMRGYIWIRRIDSEGMTVGKPQMCRSFFDILYFKLLPSLRQRHTRQLMPMAHRYYCICSLIVGADFLESFEHGDYELKLWGKLFDENTPDALSIAYYLARGLVRGNLLTRIKRLALLYRWRRLYIRRNS